MTTTGYLWGVVTHKGSEPQLKQLWLLKIDELEIDSSSKPCSDGPLWCSKSSTEWSFSN